MSDFQIMPKAKLKAVIADTEETLAELKAELQRREEAAQEAELEHLDVHFRNAELSLQSIRNFFVYLRDEMRR